MNAATQGKMTGTKKKTAGKKRKTAGKKRKTAGKPGQPVIMLGGGPEQKVVEVPPGSIVIRPGSVIIFDGTNKCFVTGIDPSGKIVFARSVDDALGATGPLLQEDFAEPAGVSPELLVMMEPYLLPNLTQDDLHGLI